MYLSVGTATRLHLLQPLLLTYIKAGVATKVVYSSGEGDFQGLGLGPVEIKGGNLQDVRQAQVCRVTVLSY